MGDVTVSALRGVSFSLYEAEFIAILGPSGSGKSTMLNIIGGIDNPSSGDVIYLNKNISKLSSRELTRYRRDAIGFVFQFYNLISSLTAKENIELASELSEHPIQAEILLQKIGMTDRSQHFPSQMSGGQQQRVAIARAVAKNPHILLSDEPTGALDFITGVKILRLLKDFNKEYKKTVVVITHNISIGSIADRVFHIRDGLIEKIEKNERPADPEEISW